MGYLTSEGLVLRDTKLGDNDSLLTVLTGGHGKLTFKAWGIRGKSGKLRAACQLFAYSEFTVSENKGYYSIKEAEAKEQFPGLRSDIELLALASYISQVTEAVSDADSPTPELLALALNSFYALSSLKKPQALVKAAFELRLMCLAGYEPQAEGCVLCGNPEPVIFDPGEGALLCPQCGKGAGLPLCPESLAALRRVVLGDPKRLFSFTISEDALKRLGSASEAFLLTQLERGFSTLDFYKSLSI